MKTDSTDKKKARADLLRTDRESTLDLNFAAVEGGDIKPSNYEAERHLAIKKQRGERIYTDMLFVLTNQKFRSDQAEKLWFPILAHKEELTRTLCRNPGN